MASPRPTGGAGDKRAGDGARRARTALDEGAGRSGGRARDTRFLDPALLARLGSMELKARTVVEGFVAGLHRSPYRGFSVEFAEYRPYMPGDDLARKSTRLNSSHVEISYAVFCLKDNSVLRDVSVR